MKLLRATTLATIIALLSVIGLNAEPMEYSTGYQLSEELVVPGRVDVVLTGEKLVRLKTEYGALIEVPLDNLALFETDDAGYQELEPGLFVQARMHPGTLGVAPADRGQFWVLIDGEQVVKLNPEDIDEKLFVNDENEVRVNGRKIDVSLAEILVEQSSRLENI
jgi:hypothetical protein